jgi:nicotinamidase-related amidase
VDLNYKFVVIADACGDREPEVHDFLVQRLFPKWGTVATAAQFQKMIAVTTDAA